MILENMLANVRTNAGLGNPAPPFYTNVPESANALIKRAVNFKENEMASFCMKIAQMIKEQSEDIRGALINRGPHKLVPMFSNLQLTQEKWFSMSVSQRKSYQAKFDRAANENICNHQQADQQGDLFFLDLAGASSIEGTSFANSRKHFQKSTDAAQQRKCNNPISRR